MNERDFPQFLLRQGAINNNQLQELLLDSERTNEKFGKLLINKKILPKKEVLNKLEQYVRSID